MRTAERKHQHRVRVLKMLMGLTLVVVGGVLFLQSHKKTHPVSSTWTPVSSTAPALQVDGTVLAPPRVLNDFAFTDQFGHPFTKASLLGHWNILFMGFSNCGMICPTTLSELAKMYKVQEKTLSPEQLPQVVMISVDPERDTVLRMKHYVKAFDPHFVGVRGTEEQTRAMAHQLSAVYMKMQEKGKDAHHYWINHSAELMIVDPEGHLRAFLSYPHHADELVQDYKKIIDAFPVEKK